MWVFQWLGASSPRAALAFFEEALELAESSAVKMRVEKASIAAYRLAIDPLWHSNPDPETLREPGPLIARFLELCDTYQVSRVDEHTKLSDVRTRLETFLNG